MALTGGALPYVATFLTFSDYMRPSIRLAALTGLGVVYVFTHDSIGLGEDGPTHQSIEHYLALRAIPNLYFIRPADAQETAEAWQLALERRHAPTALALTRQNLPPLDRTTKGEGSVTQGGYVLWEGGPGETLQCLLLATGSEVSIAMEAATQLAGEGVRVRVVSMPCWERFDEQSDAYKQAVLPPDVTARVAMESGVTLGWERYIGPKGIALGIDGYGASAPYATIYQEYGLTASHMAAAAKTLLGP